jgi:hypothetical protein
VAFFFIGDFRLRGGDFLLCFWDTGGGGGDYGGDGGDNRDVDAAMPWYASSS